jgi:taurine dioxygenase
MVESGVEYEAAVDVRPREGGFGAEIRGVDLAQPLSAPALRAVKAAWAAHSVIWFPEQSLSLDELEAFTLQFGPFGEDPFVKPMLGHPHVLELRREPTERVSNFGAAWHSDWSFQAAPPSATILHAQIVPPTGGDTLFADCYRAYERLSPTMQRMLAGLQAIHSAALPYGPRGLYAGEAGKRAIEIIVSEEAERTWPHPVVRTHPVSGRKALYVNPVYTVGIEGLTPAESRALLTLLYEGIVAEDNVYRHSWSAGMLTMWDNRCVLHFADGGYDGHLRVMHRTTVAGEIPAG